MSPNSLRPFARHPFFSCCLVLALLLIVAALLTNPPRKARAAATFTVNDLGDGPDFNKGDGVCSSGPQHVCTLRAAIEEANAHSGDYTINFSVTGTIQLSAMLPVITSNITINGPGARSLILRLDTDNQQRILTIQSGATVNISGLTVTNGHAQDGGRGGSGDVGGGIANFGTLFLRDSTVSGNRSGNAFDNTSIVGNGGGAGGGIYNDRGATLTVLNCTVSGNQAGDGGRSLQSDGHGGAGGGIANFGTLNLVNSTVSGNSSGSSPRDGKGGAGGGVFSDGPLTLLNSTIASNTAAGIDSGGGGVAVRTATIGSNIIADNDAPSGCPDVNGNFNSLGFNLVETADAIIPNVDIPCASINAGPDGDLIGVDPQLQPLASNGGPTDTHALNPNSPAIDKGKNFATDSNNNPILTDQRGSPRPVDLNDATYPDAADGDGSDIGAFEVQPPPNHPPVASCQDVTLYADSNCSATVGVGDVNGGSSDPDAGDSITLSFNSSSVVTSATLGLGDHTVTLNVTDTHGAQSSCTATVHVVDKTPPTISGASASPNTIWPPNGKLVDVVVSYSTADNCSPVNSTLSVSSNEPTSAGDMIVVDNHHVRLRADRLGGGSGRVYTITIKATDASGNSSQKSVTVTVPHDQR
jgi:CSLREA domain-containing protein